MMFESRLHVDTLHQRRGRNQSQQDSLLNENKRSYLGIFKENIHQYALNSSLHGLKYIGDRTITRFER